MKLRAYVALLRGINVAGNNLIRMADLKACFEGIPCADVTTYIQSGNVIFYSDAPDPVAGSDEGAIVGA